MLMAVTSWMRNLRTISFTSDEIGTDRNFLKEGLSVQILKYNGTASLTPQFVELEVTSTELGQRGDTAAGGAAKTSDGRNGTVVRVPLFIKEGSCSCKYADG